MKKKNGFTLIELLAVIVIMGILMLVAIPAISRVIENSRKDTFVDIAKSYANSAKTLWSADTLTCNGVAPSAVDDGDYYILINTKDSAKGFLPVLLDQGGKSSWGNRDVNGYVRVHVETTAGGKRTTTFYVGLSDGTHGVVDNGSLKSEDLRRGNVTMKLSATDKKKVEVTQDDGVLRCVETSNGYVCIEAVPPTMVTGICDDGSSLTKTLEAKEPVNFATDDWATIAVAARGGTYTGKYNVGDTKEVDLGTLGKHTVRIANTSTPAECSNSGFSQTACGFVIEFADAITKKKMNTEDTNLGSWPASSMREYINKDVYNALPVELRSVIIDTKVVSGYGWGDKENFTSTDKLYLLDQIELIGNNSFETSSVLKGYQRQLDYYQVNGVSVDTSDIFHHINNSTLMVKTLADFGVDCWVRSPYADVFSTYRFDFTARGSTELFGVAPAFRIA